MDVQAIVSAAYDGVAHLFLEAFVIWNNGGWAMWAIATIAVVMFATGSRVWVGLGNTRYQAVREPVWRAWIEHPSERSGRIGALLDYVLGTKGAVPRIGQTIAAFDHLRAIELDPMRRDLRVMRVCVSAAPLVGLLGTVTGMLSTFNALAYGSGGEKTMTMVAGGISEALITTETGLVVALPGVFFQYHLQRGYERYQFFLARLETCCLQRCHRKANQDKVDAARQEAALQLAHRLEEAVGT